MEDKIKEQDNTRYYNDITDYETEDNNTDNENNKTRISKYMTIIIVLMLLLLGTLVFLNKYYNG